LPTEAAYFVGRPRFAIAAAPDPALQFQPPAKDDRVSAPATALLPGGWLLICCFMIAEVLKTTTRRGDIGTSMPVLGLRPRRPPFLRTVNDPNEVSFTVSPFSRQPVAEG
jgi:hypothetical protein